MKTFKNIVGILIIVAVAAAALDVFQPEQPLTVAFAHMYFSPAIASDFLVGSPTVSAEFMDQVLDHAGSPARGMGKILYQLGIEYDIDPVFALAFFKHESSFGLQGVAVETHSLGNIRCTTGWTCDHTGGYRCYPNWMAGAADWFIVIKSVYIETGLDTVATIIPRYAPQVDNNNEAAYIQSVMSDVMHWRQGQL